MTAPDGWFCRECRIHRTRAADSLCPVCLPDPAPNPAAPAPRMALDRPAPIVTSSGEA